MFEVQRGQQLHAVVRIELPQILGMMLGSRNVGDLVSTNSAVTDA